MACGDLEARLAAAAEAKRERQAVLARQGELRKLIEQAEAQVAELSRVRDRQVARIGRQLGDRAAAP